MARKSRRQKNDTPNPTLSPRSISGTGGGEAAMQRVPVDWRERRRRLLEPWYREGTRWVFWVILTLIVLMGAVRWQTNAGRSFWIDEFHSLRLGQYFAAEIEETGERFHTGFFATISPFTLGSQDERTVRTPSVLAAVLGVGFMAILGGLWGGRWMALSAAVVGVMAPRVLFHGGELRYYAFLFMLGAMALLLLESCRRRKGAWALPLGGLTAAYAFSIHPASGPYMLLVGAVAFTLVIWDFSTSIRPCLANRAENPVAAIRVLWLGLMIAGGLLLPVVFFSRVAELWNEQFGAVLSGRASRAPNLEASWAFVSSRFSDLYFPVTSVRFLQKATVGAWFGAMFLGPILLFRRNPVLALFVPISYVLYFGSFYFVPAKIPMAVKYSIAGLPGLLLLIAGILSEVPHLFAAKWPKAGPPLFATLLMLWVGLGAHSAYLAIVGDISHYRQTVAHVRELNPREEPPILFAGGMLHAGTRYYAEQIPRRERPAILDPSHLGLPGILHSLASERSVFYGISTERSRSRERFLEKLEPFMEEFEVLESPIVSPYSVHLWRPRAEVVAIPGRRIELDDQGIEALTGEGLQILTPGQGAWQLAAAPEGATLFVNGTPLPLSTRAFVSPTSSVLTLRLESPQPVETATFQPAGINGLISCPGGLASRAALTPHSIPVFRDGLLAMHFSRSYWAEYTFDVPSDAQALMVTLEEVGQISAAFEILMDGKPFAIIAGAMGSQDLIEGPFQRVVRLPEEARGRRVHFRFTFLSETYMGDNEGTILEVALLGEIPLGLDHNLLPILKLTPPTSYAVGDFPPPKGDPFWSQVRFSEPEATNLQIRSQPEGGAYLAVPVERDTPTLQIILPPFQPEPGSWIYCEYEARQVDAPQHSLGMFAVMRDENNEQISLSGFTKGLQGQESDGWCRYGALMPVPDQTRMAILYWQVYRHPEEDKPPTLEGSELRFRNFRIFGPEDVGQVPTP